MTLYHTCQTLRFLSRIYNNPFIMSILYMSVYYNSNNYSMGQNQSSEVNNKIFYLSPPTEQVEIISESNPNTECQDTTNEQDRELTVSKKHDVYYQDEYLHSNPL